MEGYSLKKFFKSPFPVKTLPYLLLIFSFLGLLDSVFLTIQHYQNSIPPCTVGGCETVLTSHFATIGTVPVALIGAGFYLLIIVLAGVYIQTKAKNLCTLLFILSSGGFVVGLGLIFIQAYVLHAWCYYCLFSELIDFLLFDTAWWLWNSK